MKNLFNKGIELYKKYKEVINYLIFGGLTTVVSMVSYFIFTRVFGIDEVVSSAISWFCAVTFAYITNKIWVFESKTNTVGSFFKEAVMLTYFLCITGNICVIWISNNMQSYESICGKMPKKLLSR